MTDRAVSMSPDRARLKLIELRAQLAELDRRLPAAVRAVLLEVSVHDGFASRGDSAGRGAGGSSVEAAAGRLGPLLDELQDLTDWFDTLACSVGLMTSWVERRAPVEVEHPRCGDLTPRDLKLQPWFDATCTALAEYDRRDDGSIRIREHGLCPRHRRAMNDHGREVLAAQAEAARQVGGRR